jgi:hypothetical protein
MRFAVQMKLNVLGAFTFATASNNLGRRHNAGRHCVVPLFQLGVLIKMPLYLMITFDKCAIIQLAKSTSSDQEIQRKIIT